MQTSSRKLYTLTRLLSIAAFLALLPASLMAQATGLIVGTVQDASGAVIPGAQVKAINELTGLEWETVSDQGGRFNFPRMPVGNYHVEVTQQGFTQFLSEPFRLDADQSRQVTVALEVGQVTESITVAGAVTEVETVGGTLKEIIDERRITELPLNGRNPVQLILLVPGVVSGPGSSSLNQNMALAVNGARAVSNNYLLDGGDNNDPQQNVAAIMPNPDALEEFSVLTNNFSAEYGRNMGAIINAVTKSGTNQYHGSAYEFLRNDALDARSFFGLATGKLRRNQFGATTGGPIAKNRTFFFGAYEGVRQRQAATFSGLFVPTALERAGDFSATGRKPKDPLTGEAFPNHLIPETRFDAASLNFLNELIPLPTSAAGRHIFNRPNNFGSDQYIGRVDHQISDAQRLSGRLLRQTSNEFKTGGLPRLTADINFINWNAQGQHTWTLTPSLLATAQFTFNRTEIDRGPLPTIGESGQEVSYQSLGVGVNRGAPESQIELVPHYRGQVNGFWNLRQENLVRIDRKTFQGRYDVSYTSGAHMMKFGGEYRHSQSFRVTANLVDPQFNFTGRFSGNSYGDFLLGRPANFRQGSLRINDIRARAPNFYFQDDWKIRSNVTLSLGMRWEPYLPFYSAPDELSVFREGRQSTLFPNAPEGLLYANDSGVHRGGAPADWNNFAPRLGLAWSPFGHKKTSIRAAYGVFYDTPRFHYLSHFVNSPPYSLQTRVNGPESFTNPYGGMANPFPYQQPQTDQERAEYQYIFPVEIGLSVAESTVAAYNQQWNFNVQQELVRDFIVTAAYVGSKATKLPLRRQINPAIFREGATLRNTNQRRIFGPTFQGIRNYETSAYSTYHAAQFTVNKRFSKGYTVLAHYTVGKAIDLSATESAPPQDPLNLRLDKALADFDVRQRFVASFLWDLPSPSDSGVGKWVLGGWQTNGIFTAQSGRAFSATTGRDIALAGFGRQRPHLVGNPFLDTGRSKGELIQQYFDASAFENPVTGTFGNAGRNIIIGPGNWNLDFALFKKFGITERMELQLRWEMFNAFNHANLLNPRNNINARNPGRITGTSAPRIMQFGLRLEF